MAVSKTDICNNAIGRIGAQRIMSIDDQDSKSARICKNAYEMTLREVLRLGVWNFAKDRATLAELSTTPAFGWAKQFQLPTDYIRLLKLNGVDVNNDGTGDFFEIEGRKLLTDADAAQIQYIKFVDDPNQYDALFVEALVVLLASKIAVPIRQDEPLAQSLTAEFLRIKLPTARKTDANEKKGRRYDPASESRFVNARYVSTNG
jgi:hypothetical protein